ncbi:uncharacterized protein LOC114156040 isoform X1 [Xiphophorus couchianus]|uniref:uncharacterized protein LOC114156040 isoform X1 n=1 Tax=Xiphophorus couchianus TaxID=32473 RepID=UPI0010163D1D|nr:uncharacterized protein LOC114156040 isoform X1 [Xiphophorus couchianus]
MKTLLLFGILLHVSQHALGGVVEVNEGAESVLLRCQGSYAVPEVNPSVLWSRNDLNPKVIHLRREQGDDHKDQNQVYRRRTSMHLDALQTGDFDLTLRKPQLADSGNYTCSISDGRAELKLAQVQLEVKVSLIQVKVNEKAESVILPCKTKAGLKENTVVEWIRSDPDFRIVHVSSNTSECNTNQDGLYRGRTEMNADLLRTGDLSLTLKIPTERDSGSYICTIYRDEDILRQTVVLHHVTEEPSPTDVSGLFISVVLVLVVVGGCIYWCYFYPKSVHQVKVESGSECVLLRCWFPFPLIPGFRVEWTDSRGKKVSVYPKGLDSSNYQEKAYEGRTEMNKDLMKFGVFSLTIRNPLERDGNTYTCTVYSRKGKDLKKKQVMLNVKVLQVEVDSGAESVELPFKATADLPEKAKVEWRDQNNWTVHVFQNGSDHLHQQNWYYKGRTEMKKNAVKDKDLSLTVKHLTESDAYACTVYGEEGEILLRKEVRLHVKVFEMEVEPGVESVQLPFQTPQRLNCEEIEVEWTNSNGRKVHKYCSSDQHEDWFSSYACRTELNEDLVKTGDFSLTLKYPTDWDTDTYTCKVYGAEGTILVKKRVALHVKEHQVEVQDRNVQLPFRTTPELLEDCRVEWLQVQPKYRVVHVWENGSDQPGGQTQTFREKTNMKENLINTGDLSLTLEDFIEDDSGKYKCTIYGKHGRILQEKTVQVLMKGTVQVQNQPKDIRTRGSSVDPTPLMADQ